VIEAACAARPRCPVCKSPHRAQIEALKATKMPLADIHAQTQKLGRGIKRETLGKHFRICLGGVSPEVLGQQIADASAEAKTVAEMDFAALVQQRAVTQLREGTLRVTTQHGLTAQALLDRRAEKAQDRDLLLNMARLLSGAISMPPLTVIEARDVTPRLLDDGLAPDDIVDPVRA
jgi:hypothetical protein